MASGHEFEPQCCANKKPSSPIRCESVARKRVIDFDGRSRWALCTEHAKQHPPFVTRDLTPDEKIIADVYEKEMNRKKEETKRGNAKRKNARPS